MTMEATIETVSEFEDRVRELCNDGERIVLSNPHPYPSLAFDHGTNVPFLLDPTGRMYLPENVNEEILDDILNDLVLGHYHVE